MNGSTSINRVQVVLGAQWGDEGKGKIVDLLAGDQDVVCRCQGGNNAGHTVVVGEQAYDFHLLPSGIINERCLSIIGSGVVIHLPGLFAEIEANEKKGLTDWRSRLIISNRAHIVLNLHQMVDGYEETARGSKNLGTTKKGIGPTYASKSARHGLRICDLMGDWNAFCERYKRLSSQYQRQHPDLNLDCESELTNMKIYRERIRPMVQDTVRLMHKCLNEDKKILVEGANATMLDIDFGTYPFVTSSNCSIGGVCTGLGIPTQKVGHVIGVVKAYTTRVGPGGLPTELCDEIGDKLQSIGHEFGTTTGRRRRCGWLDLAVIKYTAQINGYSKFAITKLDILDTFVELKICTHYKKDGEVIDYYPASDEELRQIEPVYVTLPGWNSDISECTTFSQLPSQAQSYINVIQENTGIPVGYIGVGKSRAAIIKL